MSNNNPPFYVGQEVVCVDDRFNSDEYEIEIPKKGKNYHIRTIEYFEHGWYCRLEEIINPVCLYETGFVECVFSVTAFRPLQRHPVVEIAEELKDSEEWVRERTHEGVDEKVKEIAQ